MEKDALKVIAVLYVAMRRQGWEEGPTISEAEEMAHDFYYNKFGHDVESARTFLTKLGGGKMCTCNKSHE